MTNLRTERRRELAENLDQVRARLSAACAAAGRSPDAVTLVAVTKTWPASDVLHLAALGVTDVGENRDQEAAPKAARVAESGVDVRWHFIGRLQRNKARSVVEYAALVHSVDSVRLADALADATAKRRPGPLDVLVQVSLDGRLGHAGALAGSPDADAALDRVLERVSNRSELVLRGLMAMAPLDWEPERAYALLARIAADTRRTYADADVLSAGMSNDAEEAIRYGATHVRIGTALLGNRITLL